MFVCAFVGLFYTLNAVEELRLDRFKLPTNKMQAGIILKRKNSVILLEKTKVNTFVKQNFFKITPSCRSVNPTVFNTEVVYFNDLSLTGSG